MPKIKTTEQEEIPQVGEKEKKYVQQVIGSFLCYARATDMTMLQASNAIAAEQSKPAERIMERVEQFPDYIHTHPDPIIRFR